MLYLLSSLHRRQHIAYKLNKIGTFHLSALYRRFLTSGSYRLSPSDTLTVGGGTGRHRGVLPKGEGFFEYGHGFRVEGQGVVRGIEVAYRQRWLWFRDARVLALTPRVSFYLPSDWTLSVQVTDARSRFPGADAEWRLSGSMRLSFPVHQRLTAHAFTEQARKTLRSRTRLAASRRVLSEGAPATSLRRGKTSPSTRFIRTTRRSAAKAASGSVMGSAFSWMEQLEPYGDIMTGATLLA